MRVSLKRKVDSLKYNAVRPLFLLPILITLLLMGILINIYPNASFLFHASPQPDQPKSPETLATNGAQRWVGDSKITPPTTTFSASPITLSVSPLFTHTYQRYQLSTKVNSLGVPLTTAFPTSYGWLQFFTSGALLSPTTKQIHTDNSGDPYADLIHNGVLDKLSGVVRLPLLQALLTAGSPLPLDGGSSSLNYADLRKATDPVFMRYAPSSLSTNTNASSTNTTLSPGTQNLFIQTGTRTGRAVGHFIPAIVWKYLHLPALAPNGWEEDFGAPLTEAITFTRSVHGVTHHMLIQAFARNFITLDLDILTSSQAQESSPITLMPMGLDYLRTYGLPPVTPAVRQQIWTQVDAVPLDAVKVGHSLAHLGQGFPLTLLGDSVWTDSTLWYHVQWTLPKGTKNGWILASSVTFQSPSSIIAQAHFDALSPDLSSYLSSLGTDTGAAVYDITHHRYYTYNGSAPFLTASSMKVPIMLTFLDMIEQQGREPSSDEMSMLTTMIENSNNDSASALYFNSINGSQGINSYMQKIGITGLDPDDAAWGYSQITPQTMVDLLTLLHDGKILNSDHRTLALNLMENVEADQQVGVGDTAPVNANVALKDGWVMGPDNLWAVNSSGIVTTANEKYIVSVYTQEQPSLDDGQTIVRKVCGDIASLLNP